MYITVVNLTIIATKCSEKPQTQATGSSFQKCNKGIDVSGDYGIGRVQIYDLIFCKIREEDFLFVLREGKPFQTLL